MYATSIYAGTLEAYMTMPPCFLQDGYFGTDLNSGVGNGQRILVLVSSPVVAGAYVGAVHHNFCTANVRYP